MITMAVFAIIGAALGMFVRPRPLGVALSILLALTVEGVVFWVISVMARQPNREVLILRLREAFGADLIGMAGPIAAATISALFAAVLGDLTAPKKPRMVLNADEIQRRAGKDGRYARAKGMVEERAIHAQAESRIDSILGL
ncbi:hypothetical protein [uncultured Caulobacter sp.]|uniref:hypothetical protein n=1 Tax=uncultured Caulobacter sp. TaxID=158749 RepID=UPI0026036869|nr:hypothetical protein [uncultured Caulobacter sp.]